MNCCYCWAEMSNEDFHDASYECEICRAWIVNYCCPNCVGTRPPVDCGACDYNDLWDDYWDSAGEEDHQNIYGTVIDHPISRRIANL